MSQLGRWFDSQIPYSPDLSMEEAAVALLFTFVLAQIGAWVYIYTHHGLSYSRSFVQSLILLSVILTTGVMVIGSNIAIAFGLVGALSVIRFRNILKDTRDTAFVFFALIISMACGTRNYPLAIVGTAAFCFLTLYLYWSEFGARNIGDGYLRFQWDARRVAREAWQPLLIRHCSSSKLVAQRFQEGGVGEASYRLSMRNPLLADQLVEELHSLDGISNVTFVLQEEETEI